MPAAAAATPWSTAPTRLWVRVCQAVSTTVSAKSDSYLFHRLVKGPVTRRAECAMPFRREVARNPCFVAELPLDENFGAEMSQVAPPPSASRAETPLLQPILRRTFHRLVHERQGQGIADFLVEGDPQFQRRHVAVREAAIDRPLHRLRRG